MSALRIVSLVPAGTEILYTLGLRDALVGRSHGCVGLPEVEALPVCTETIVDSGAGSAEIHRRVQEAAVAGEGIVKVLEERVVSLRPDLIIVQEQCGVCAPGVRDLEVAFRRLGVRLPRVVSLKAARLKELWDDMLAVGIAAAQESRTRDILKALKGRCVDILEKTCAEARRPKVLCLEWLDPLITAGHWMPDLVEFAGGAEVLAVAGAASSGVSWAQVAAARPDLIVVSPCGMDVPRIRKELGVLAAHPDWRRLRAVQEGSVYLVDGDRYFNRPGPGLVDSLAILAEIMHPTLFKTTRRGQVWESI